IGYLYSGLSGASPVLEGFRQGLRERGYVEEKSIAIEYRFDEGYLARLPTLAAELVRLKVDVIIAAGGAPAILAAKNATSTIPIIFPTVGDPVAQGIVASFARPGGNITGLTIMTPDTSAWYPQRAPRGTRSSAAALPRPVTVGHDASWSRRHGVIATLRAWDGRSSQRSRPRRGVSGRSHGKR